jgi:hypothetical protein
MDELNEFQKEQIKLISCHSRYSIKDVTVIYLKCSKSFDKTEKYINYLDIYNTTDSFLCTKVYKVNGVCTGIDICVLDDVVHITDENGNEHELHNCNSVFLENCRKLKKWFHKKHDKFSVFAKYYIDNNTEMLTSITEVKKSKLDKHDVDVY